ncbi:hypothetical protein PSM7751_03839 [Pseudooceanicola marinus]|uniref:Uncharacterized protein n=1 Tax=Pseudooceanicola marinus TaxID=396013 RepID=A0A1X7A5X5_9RHOB|nr:hypothetical protein [Pseudooceanicola marinus]SLN71489.1 hypothetical protein PSM7751_03839 [Pseudooceanicola marinus]
MTSNAPTMLDILHFGQALEGGTERQYATHFERMFRKRGYQDRHLETLEGTLEVYLQVAPKYRKGNADLNARILDWGITPRTYKQYQSDGRRMIETYAGELLARRARRERQDGFARLQAVVPDLVSVGLLKASQARNLPRLIDLARVGGWDMCDITRERIISLREDCLSTDEWTRVKQAAGCLDYLRQFPTCLPLLPQEEIGTLAGVLRLDTQLPAFLDEEARTWVRDATVVYHDDMLTVEARCATAKEYSESCKAVYIASLRTYMRAVQADCDLDTVNGLTALFRPELIEKTLIRLCKKSGTSGGLAPRTLFSYSLNLKRALSIQGLVEEAAKVEQLIKTLPVLVEGQAASKMMSPKVETWCRDLLNDPNAMEIFETQHFLYAEKALAALELADLEGIDLLAFSRSPHTQPLCADRARLAADLLRQARMFGVCAAFAAIELEGAPFRKSNVISDLRSSDHPQTFFDHRDDKTRPRLEIHFPNELLKNGDAMTRRNQYLPRFVFEKDGLGAEGYRILSFYLNRIRPLFGGADLTDHVVPAIEAEHRSLVISTFDGWLTECSTSIGLPLLPHNFRHGLCKIEIFYDPTCYPELETLTGDTEKTLRQHYAFIDRARQSRTLQQKRYERRAQRMQVSPLAAEIPA